MHCPTRLVNACGLFTMHYEFLAIGSLDNALIKCESLILICFEPFHIDVHSLCVQSLQDITVMVVSCDEH